MIERGPDFGFTLEAPQSLRIGGERLRQDLDGNLAPELCIARAIELAHAPCA
ncbi:MAG: hypothetical protein HY048_16900 [Acidobacteria bacterium]|nr:hypothetical protein [Acidobacteriota bacterium]